LLLLLLLGCPLLLLLQLHLRLQLLLLLQRCLLLGSFLCLRCLQDKHTHTQKHNSGHTCKP
jgi:hypothetical protein